MRKEIIEKNLYKPQKEIAPPKEKFFFSVIICTYNRDNLLSRALDSLVHQTFTNFETIIVDDGSTDRTFSVVKEFREKLNLRYIYQQNKGLPTARNTGGYSAEGEFITFLDSDDEYKPNHLEIRFNILNSDNGIKFLFGGVEIIGNKYVPDANNPENLVEISQCVVGGTFFIHKDLFHKLGGFPNVGYGDDFEFFKKVLESKVKIHKIEEPTYVYHRETTDSICNRIINQQKRKK